MSSPMLAIKHNRTAEKSEAVPNLLPCRVHHTGSVDPVASFWNPIETEGANKTAYFRGRKLQSKTVLLPERYRGAIVEREAASKSERQPVYNGHDDEQAESRATENMVLTAHFDKMEVWSHDAVSDSASDPYQRAIEEWLGVAEQIHSYPNQVDTNSSEK